MDELAWVVALGSKAGKLQQKPLERLFRLRLPPGDGFPSVVVSRTTYLTVND